MRIFGVKVFSDLCAASRPPRQQVRERARRGWVGGWCTDRDMDGDGPADGRRRSLSPPCAARWVSLLSRSLSLSPSVSRPSVAAAGSKRGKEEGGLILLLVSVGCTATARPVPVRCLPDLPGPQTAIPNLYPSALGPSLPSRSRHGPLSHSCTLRRRGGCTLLIGR